MRNREFVVWTDSLDVVTGQSIVTQRVIARNFNASDVLYFRISGKSFFLTYFVALFRALYRVVFKRRALYITPSRSMLGAIKDLPIIFAALCFSRVYAHFHGSDVTRLLRFHVLGGIYRFALTYMICLFPSRHLIEDEGLGFIRKRFLCENFSNLAGFNAQEIEADRFSLDGFCMSILWNSNIISSKGFFDVYSAVEKFNLNSSNGRQVKLVAIGASMSDVEAKKADIDVFLRRTKETWFEYIGPVSVDLMCKFLLACDAVILPSRYHSECQPLALLDAMWLGKKIAILDSPALLATVGNYPVYLVSRDVDETLVDQIHSILRSWSSCPKLDGDISPSVVSARQRFGFGRFDDQVKDILYGSD